MEITVEMIKDWLDEQEEDVIVEIQSELSDFDCVHHMSSFDYVMSHYGILECIEFALSADHFDPHDEYFKYEYFELESANYVYELIDYEELAKAILNEGTDNEIYKEWVKSLKKPEHTEEEINEKTQQYFEKEATDGDLVRYRKFFCPGDEFHPIYTFCDFAKKEPLADVVRKLVMTLATYKTFFDSDFFLETDSAFIPWTRDILETNLVAQCYAERDRLDDTFPDDLKKILRGDF